MKVFQNRKLNHTVFWLSGTKLVWTRSCGYVRQGTAHWRQHRWVFEENRDREAWCGDRDSDGKLSEKIQDNSNRMTKRHDALMPQNDTQWLITNNNNKKGHCQLQWQIRNGRKNIILASAIQHRDVSTDKTSILSHWVFFTLRKKLTRYKDRNRLFLIVS